MGSNQGIDDMWSTVLQNCWTPDCSMPSVLALIWNTCQLQLSYDCPLCKSSVKKTDNCPLVQKVFRSKGIILKIPNPSNCTQRVLRSPGADLHDLKTKNCTWFHNGINFENFKRESVYLEFVRNKHNICPEGRLKINRHFWFFSPPRAESGLDMWLFN